MSTVPDRRLVETVYPILDRPNRGGIVVPRGLIIEDHELLSALRLSRVGFDVAFNPWRITGIHPDVTINNEMWEIKSPEGNSPRNTIHHQFEQAKGQSGRIIIDTSRTRMDDDFILDQIRGRLRSSKQFVATMMVSKSGVVFLEEI